MKKTIEVVPAWDEAEVVGWPESKEVGEPRVLVRRKATSLDGPNGEELVYCPGMPAISLFTGAGGFDIGMEQAGFVTMVQHEWEGMCCQTLIANRPNFFRHAALIQGDIRKTRTSMLLREAGLRVGECYILVGGPPCQGFSTAGKRRLGDERNDLVFEYLRVVREAQPRFFVMENVPGFVSFNGGKYLEEFLRTAYAGYYELVYGLVNAVEYGVPQNRCRFLCMGTRRDLHEVDGMLGSLPRPETFGQGDLNKIEAFSHMPLWTEELELLTHPPGIRYFPDRPVIVPPRPIGNRQKDEDGDTGGGGRSESFLEFYRRLRKEEPDRIVTMPVAGTR